VESGPVRRTPTRLCGGEKSIAKVAGLLFLQNIHSCWIKPPPLPVLKMIAGDDVTKKLIFVTTHWDQIELNLGIVRERLICCRLDTTNAPPTI